MFRYVYWSSFIDYVSVERFSGCGSKTVRIVEAFAEHDSRVMGLLERLA